MANTLAILPRPTAAPSDPQNITLFRIYVFYRSLLSIVLMLSLFSPNTRQLLGILNPDLYLYVATAFRDGETFIARALEPYAAAVELAGQVGIELEDG